MDLLSKYLENVKDIFRLQKMIMLIFSVDKGRQLENTDFSISFFLSGETNKKKVIKGSKKETLKKIEKFQI